MLASGEGVVEVDGECGGSGAVGRVPDGGGVAVVGVLDALSLLRLVGSGRFDGKVVVALDVHGAVVVALHHVERAFAGSVLGGQFQRCGTRVDEVGVFGLHEHSAFGGRCGEPGCLGVGRDVVVGVCHDSDKILSALKSDVEDVECRFHVCRFRGVGGEGFVCGGGLRPTGEVGAEPQ